MQVSDNGTLVNGAFVRVRRSRLASGRRSSTGKHTPARNARPHTLRLQDRFLGWECAGAGGVINFWTRTSDYDGGTLFTFAVHPHIIPAVAGVAPFC